MQMLSIWTELGISGGTALIVLLALYFVVKWAVKNGVKEALDERDQERLNFASQPEAEDRE